MSGYPSLASLRQAAQKILDQGPVPAPPGLDPVAMLHELQIHQVELELQMNALKEALAEAESSKARFQDLFQLAPMGCFSVSLEGEILEINRKGLAMLGITAETAAGRQLRAFFDAGSLPGLEVFFQTVRETDAEVATPEPLLLKAHLKLPILVSGQARAGTDLATRKSCLRLALMDVSAETLAREDALSALDRLSGLTP
jgi:transcriptional regulator with PAS, ATPase and Fis domain